MKNGSLSVAVYRGLIYLGNLLQPLLLLFIRLFWGWLFLQSGMAKFADIHATVKFFEALSIPLATLSAYLAAFVECIGGAFFLIGLGSRLMAVPLIALLVVACLTAHVGIFEGTTLDLAVIAKAPPFNFLLASALIFSFGPGCFSLDALLKVFWFRSDSTEQ